MPNGVKQAVPETSARHAVVARVFGKERGKGEVLEELRRRLIGEARAISLRITFCSLTECVIAIRCLVQARIEAGAEKRYGIQRILQEENEFIFGFERTEENAGFVSCRANGSAFKRAREKTNGLFHWTLVVLKADERRRFDALRIGLLCCLRVPNIRFDLRLL